MTPLKLFEILAANGEGQWVMPYASRASAYIDFYTYLAGDPPPSYGSKFAAGPQLAL